MDFVVVRVDEAQGLVSLSREGAISKTTWDQLQTGDTVEARVVGTNKGGLELEIPGGVRAFMPASHVDLRFVEDLETYAGQKLIAVVQEVNRKGKRAVLSRRLHLEAERRANKEKIWSEVEVDQVRDGVVTSIARFGAFVDLGGVDGLLHVADISYERVNRTEDFLSVGQEVTVMVLKLDKEKDRISLGLKQIQPDPWDAIASGLTPGDRVTGRVVRTAPFGAFVELSPGVDGLVPNF